MASNPLPDRVRITGTENWSAVLNRDEFNSPGSFSALPRTLATKEPMNSLGIQKVAVLVLGLLLFWNSGRSVSQDEAQVPKIDFTKSIKPIIDTRCATCHNEDDEEGGLDLNDTERLLEYVTAGEPLESGLYQSLTGAEGLSVMPPEEDNDGNALDPCTNSEMALIYLWIQQGGSLAGVKVEPKEEATQSAARRIFLFTGYFHPAVVHFPIALITMSAVFIVLFFRIESLSDDAAYYLLFFGTLSSIVACVFGWAFADKNPVALTDFSIGINRHRWFGIGATVLALVSVILGWRARNEVIGKRSGLWKFGVIITAALMGLVGHQGGEEVYGEGMYERAAQKLIPEFWPFGEPEKSDQAKPNQKGEGESPDPANGEGQNNDEATQPEISSENQSGQGPAENESSENEKTNDDAAGEQTPPGSGTEDSGDDPTKKDDGSGDENQGSSSPPTDPTIKSGDQ